MFESISNEAGSTESYFQKYSPVQYVTNITPSIYQHGRMGHKL